MTAVASTKKVLCISEDARLASVVHRAAGRSQQVVHVDRADLGIVQLRSDADEPFDAVFVDGSSVGLHEIRRIHRVCNNTPMMLAAASAPSEMDTVSIPDGIAVVPRMELDERRIAQELLQLLAKRELQLHRSIQASLAMVLDNEEARVAVPGAAACDIPARIFLVCDGAPEVSLPARITQLTSDSAEIEYPSTSADQIPMDAMLVVGAKRSPRLRDSGHEAKLQCEAYRVVAKPRGAAKGTARLERLGLDSIFPAASRQPRLNGHHICIDMPQAALAAWVDAGVLLPMPVDRVLVCPKCRAIPSLRPGCRACGSPWVESSLVLHHFACAHVGPIESFRSDADPGRLSCPKCLASDLVLGADCEQMPGDATCGDCGWRDTQRTLYGRCFDCAHVFPATEALEEEVIRYDVDRLEPLGFEPSP